MFIPLSTDRPLHRPPVVTAGILGITILVFCAQLVGITQTELGQQLGPIGSGLVTAMGLDPAHPVWYRFITHTLLHAGWAHLGFNMLFLWVFGPGVEDRLGRFGFLLLYLGGGAGAAGLHSVLDGHPAIGASGAVAAVAGAFAILLPLTHVRCLMFFGYIGIVNIPAWLFIIIGLAMDLWLTAIGRTGNVATLAHVGGYATGALVAFLLLATKILPRERYDVYSLIERSRRRAEFKRAAMEADSERAARFAKSPADDPRSAELATRRAAVAERITAGDLAQAALLYARMTDAFPDLSPGSVLSRRHQMDLANHLFAQQQHKLAALAYQRFAEVYRDEPDAWRSRLMVGLIAARYLGDAPRARVALDGVVERLRDSGDQDLARSILSELPVAPAATPAPPKP